LTSVEPIYKLSVTVELGTGSIACGCNLGVAEIRGSGIIHILFVVEVYPDAVGEEQLEGREAKVIHDNKPCQLAGKIVDAPF
jgi:hypothetical protein